MSLHNNNPVHLQQRLPKSQTHILPHAPTQKDTNTHMGKHAHAQHAQITIGSSEWLSRRNWSHIVSFTRVNWAECSLHTVLSRLFPLSPSLSFSLPLCSSQAAITLLSNFQLNWKHCTISFPSLFQKPLPGLGPSLSFFLFPISVPCLSSPPSPLPLLSAWAMFPGLRLSHSQNGGKAQSATSPQAVCTQHAWSLFLLSFNSYSWIP